MQDGYEIFFLDESGFILIDYKVYGWYLKGSHPVKPFVFDNHHRTSIAGALSTKGFIVAKQYDSINGETFLKFLKILKKSFQKIVLIMDNINTHYTKKLMRWYKRNKVVIIKFPKYSPQLNPIEQYWKNIKQWLGTRPPLTFNGLKRVLDEAIKDFNLWPSSYGY